MFCSKFTEILDEISTDKVVDVLTTLDYYKHFEAKLDSFQIDWTLKIDNLQEILDLELKTPMTR